MYPVIVTATLLGTLHDSTHTAVQRKGREELVPFPEATDIRR